MIELIHLPRKASSPLAYVGDRELLKTRQDLYSGENFYFGFESSNYSFLSILNNHLPLGIKKGSVVMIYQHGMEGITFNLYWIDLPNKQLTSLFQITGKPADTIIFKKLLPFVFNESYMEVGYKEESIAAEDPLYPLAKIIEQLSEGSWPDEESNEKLKDVIDLIMRSSSCTITCADLNFLEKQLSIKQVKITSEDFVTPYCLINSDPDISIELLLKRNPTSITLRNISNEYPRIEVLIPGASYTAVFEKESPELYLELQNSLIDTKQASRLLKEHFNEEISTYLVGQGISERPLTP